MPIKAKRILFIAKTRLNYTNILLSMLLSLIEMGYYVKEIDVLQNPAMLDNRGGHQGGKGPVEVRYESVRQEIEDFRPDVILFAAGGLTFSEDVSSFLKQKGIVLLGTTLSDPDVFETAKSYAHRFSIHTTNSKASLQAYKKLGLENTYYLPFGIDSRFFVPTGVVPAYKCDVVVIGHHQTSRVAITDELIKRFNTRIYGSRWPYADVSPVAYPEWLKVVHSGKMVVDFPKTRAGYQNVKVRLFEAAAAGTLLITEQLDEIGEFFEYGSEIVGYRDVDELYNKINYYLKHPDELERIAKKAQLKCAQKHMWQNRFAELFKQTGIL